MKKILILGFVSLAILWESTPSFTQQEILIPVGKVVLGNYPDGYENYPPQVVFLPDYYIDQHEVTNQEFARFVADGGYQKREYWIIIEIEDKRVTIK